MVIPGLTIVWGVAGGPPCPDCVAHAAAIIGWLRGEGWGTPRYRTRQAQRWHNLCEWALVDGGRDVADGTDLQVVDLRTVQGLLRSDFGASVREQVRGCGGALYRLCWRQMHGDHFRRWTIGRSFARRWLPTASEKSGCEENGGQAGRQAGRMTSRPVGRQRWAGWPAGRQVGWQAGRQAGKSVVVCGPLRVPNMCPQQMRPHTRYHPGSSQSAAMTDAPLPASIAIARGNALAIIQLASRP